MSDLSISSCRQQTFLPYSIRGDFAAIIPRQHPMQSSDGNKGKAPWPGVLVVGGTTGRRGTVSRYTASHMLYSVTPGSSESNIPTVSGSRLGGE